jgi:hypothetical protein
MGHIRVGRLPRTQRWDQVVGALAVLDPSARIVASTTAWAADHRLGRLRADPSLNYCVWLLARIASAGRRPDFLEALGDLGLDVRPTDSAVGFVAKVGARARQEVERHPESGPFGELATLALRRALSETIGTEGQSLFDASLEDLERAVHRHTTPARFGELATRFFGDFMARTLRFYVDKELSFHVGPGHGLATIDESTTFIADLDRFARQSARIVEFFAADWYAKYDWERGGAIGRDDAQNLVKGAIRKLRHELREPEA